MKPSVKCHQKIWFVVRTLGRVLTGLTGVAYKAFIPKASVVPKATFHWRVIEMPRVVKH